MNISHLKLLIGVIVAEKFCLRRCVFVVYKFVLHGKLFLAKQIRGIENVAKFSRVAVRRMVTILHHTKEMASTEMNSS